MLFFRCLPHLDSGSGEDDRLALRLYPPHHHRLPPRDHASRFSPVSFIAFAPNGLKRIYYRRPKVRNTLLVVEPGPPHIAGRLVTSSLPSYVDKIYSLSYIERIYCIMKISFRHMDGLQLKPAVLGATS